MFPAGSNNTLRCLRMTVDIVRDWSYTRQIHRFARRKTESWFCLVVR